MQTGLALGACVAPLARGVSNDAVIRTSAGRVRGLVVDDLQLFRGIRYGADTASRRFMPPAPPAPWRGTLDAREFGAASVQPGNEPGQSGDPGR